MSCIIEAKRFIVTNINILKAAAERCGAQLQAASGGLDWHIVLHNRRCVSVHEMANGVCKLSWDTDQVPEFRKELGKELEILEMFYGMETTRQIAQTNGWQYTETPQGEDQYAVELEIE